MNKEINRTLRFGLIGIASTGGYFVLLILLGPVISSTILLTALCYGMAMVFNFLAQGLFTFKAKRLTGTQLVRYVTMQGTALIANSSAMFVVVDQWGLPLIPAQLIVMACVTISTYLASRNWVYR
ncbi:GtrA family protein [Primorskyibacter flagellatus]|uniref:Putative flippase GtrA (Transmembrane translocase of bactoprenol-linked glucose) n=1 Tax=Primorskyibacter flagellatus TaxID=1387277 RepID=A0A1W2E1J5_9RHOB|nr:GtrA family protein [Primorskyibacter flagellatus]SMD03272.1 Putative flippase GtrA (transmembrane translocase of bactoprenol-linked glucose) [Primorskyibacter flagellatus]